ncbi:hypothetical protein HC891_03235 [Candidatus Gracilibacteria bacterium]|nr:hypothetical protein [Candidatus Gracilibacteria bacterium]
MNNTLQTGKKFQSLFWQHRIAVITVALLGALEALLLARLLARLLAARAENPAIAVLYAVTEPLSRPLARLDSAQPRFGAVLELSTFSLAICVPVLGYMLWVVLTQPGTEAATKEGEATSNKS